MQLSSFSFSTNPLWGDATLTAALIDFVWNFGEQTRESPGCCGVWRTCCCLLKEDRLSQHQTETPSKVPQRCRGALSLQSTLKANEELQKQFGRRKRRREVSNGWRLMCSCCDSVGLQTYCHPPASSFTLTSRFLIPRLHLSGPSIVI